MPIQITLQVSVNTLEVIFNVINLSISNRIPGLKLEAQHSLPTVRVVIGANAYPEIKCESDHIIKI